ncbi:hypothetical protein CRUP_020612, partial [Coryphaenoides rupestris]
SAGWKRPGGERHAAAERPARSGLTPGLDATSTARQPLYPLTHDPHDPPSSAELLPHHDVLTVSRQLKKPAAPATRRPINTTTRQHSDPPAHQHNDPSTQRPAGPSTQRPANTATRRPINTTTRQHSDPPAHQHNDPKMKLLENSSFEAVSSQLCVETGDSRILGSLTQNRTNLTH